MTFHFDFGIITADRQNAASDTKSAAMDISKDQSIDQFYKKQKAAESSSGNDTERKVSQMSQDIIQHTFNFEGTDIRTIAQDNEVRWVLSDVCKACGIGNPSDVMRRLDDDQKGVDTIETLGGPQKINVVNESGLYDVILDSRKPEAKRFRKWVTAEVIPSIRKHGAYMTDQTIERTLTDPDYLIRLATAMKEERAKRLEAERMVEEQKPKVLFADAVAASKSSVLIGELAKILTQNGYEIGQNRLFKWLRDNHYLGTVGEQWNLPRQRYVEQGLFEIRKRMVQNPDGTSRTTRTTLVTGKGQQYFVQKFLANTGKEAV